MRAEQLQPDKSNSAAKETKPDNVWYPLCDLKRIGSHDQNLLVEFVFIWDGKKFVKL